MAEQTHGPETEPMPSRPSPWALFTAFAGTGPRWPIALRTTLAMILPAAAALLLGYENEMLLIAAGGFTVVYGEAHPFRTRWLVMITAGALLTLASVSGAFVGTVIFTHLAAGGSHWWLAASAIFTTILATIGTFIQNALRLPPPGSFMIVMLAGGATMVARLGFNPFEVGAWTSLGIVSALIVGMAPALVNPHGPERKAVTALESSIDALAEAPSLARKHAAEAALQKAWFMLADAGMVRGGRIVSGHDTGLVTRTLTAHQRLALLNSELGAPQQPEEINDSPLYIDLERTSIPHSRPSVAYRIYRSIHPYSHATMTACKVFVAAVAASSISLLLKLDRPDWAVVSVMLIMQWGPQRIPGTIRAVHRVVGSLIGIGLFAGIHYFGLSGWSLLAVLAACQFMVDIFIVKNYAVGVTFTTPLALLMGGGLIQPLGTVVTSRVIEVALAVAFALLLLWVWLPNAEPRHHARLALRCNEAMGALLGALLTTTPAKALSARRDLQYELLSEERAAQTLANDSPECANQRWPRHVATQRAGYLILDYCTRCDDRELSLEEINKLARGVRESNRR